MRTFEENLALLQFMCSQAQQDLQTGHGVDYTAPPIDLEVKAVVVDAEDGRFAVAAVDCRYSPQFQHHVLFPHHDYLNRLDEGKVESYIHSVRDAVWKWAHTSGREAMPVLMHPDRVVKVTVAE